MMECILNKYNIRSRSQLRHLTPDVLSPLAPIEQIPKNFLQLFLKLIIMKLTVKQFFNDVLFFLLSVFLFLFLFPFVFFGASVG